MNILTVCFYTRGVYKSEAQRLLKSLDKYEINHAVQELEPFDSWNDAVCWKPEFIEGCLDAFKNVDGILYVDADAEFKELPNWKIFEDCHISFHRFIRGPSWEEEFLTGTMYFSNTPTIMEFVKEWKIETMRWRGSDTPEQKAMRKIWRKWESVLAVKNLPPEWVWIFDDFPRIYGNKNPVITHYQASRKYRHTK